VFLELSYSLGVNNNDNDRITKIKNQNGKYESQVDTLSNSFTFNRLVNTPGISIRWNKKKYGLTVGASAGFNNFIQKNNSENLTTRYSFVNFFPRANYTYKIKPSQSFRVSYDGYSSAPTLEQLQPIRVNTDPLNVYTGNQDLKQSFRHTFSTGYNSYNVLKEKNVFSNLNFTITRNAFV
jgi:hypothetical protein